MHMNMDDQVRNHIIISPLEQLRCLVGRRLHIQVHDQLAVPVRDQVNANTKRLIWREIRESHDD